MKTGANAIGAGIAALLISVGLGGCAQPAMQEPIQPPWVAPALAFLVASQNGDGGFAETATQDSDFVTTLWVSQALLASAKPGTSHPAGASAVAFVLANMDSATSPEAQDGFSASNTIALGIFFSMAIGADPRDVGGADLVARLAVHQNASGAIGSAYNENVMGAGALAFAAVDDDGVASKACGWLFDETGRRDWDSFAEESWFVSNALLALAECQSRFGSDDPGLVDAGFSFLERFWRGDGGFASRLESNATDASTTANAVSALKHASLFRPDDPPAITDRVLVAWPDYVVGLQRNDGAVRFSQTVEPPVMKTTAEVLLAQYGAGVYRISEGPGGG